MLTQAFESRMKKKPYDSKSAKYLIEKVSQCLHKYAPANIHLDAYRLTELINHRDPQVNYFEAGVMLQMVKGAPLSAYCAEDDDHEVMLSMLTRLEAITNDFNKVAEESAEAAEREVKTKIQIMSK